MEKLPGINRIVFVSIDTLRADHLSVDGYPRETAPLMSKMAKSGAYFTQCYAASSHTNPSHATMLTGLVPFEHGSLRNGDPYHPQVASLPEYLKKDGFRTAAFTGVRFLKSIGDGFDTFGVLKKNVFWGFRHGSKVIDETIQWTNSLKADDKFFLFVHLYDVHEWQHKKSYFQPHIKKVLQDATVSTPQLMKNLMAERQIRPSFIKSKGLDFTSMINRYDGLIRYTDAQLERLDTHLKRILPNQNILWIITSDHGEALGQHDELGHGKHLYNAQLRVPLIVYLSGHDLQTGKIDNLVRHVDLMPTILELGQSSVSYDPETISGRSFASLLDGRNGNFRAETSFAERRPANAYRIKKFGWTKSRVYSIQDENYKYIYSSKGKDQFFHIAKDPGETNNLINKKIEQKMELKNQLLSLIDGKNVAKKSKKNGYIENLRSLGYVQ